MLRDPKVIEFLNLQLTHALSAINLHFLHARMLDHWGIGKLAAYAASRIERETQHADRLTRRILVLKGIPNLQRIHAFAAAEGVDAILTADRTIKTRAIEDLREAIAYCEIMRDYVSRDLLTLILQDEERHLSFLDHQIDLVAMIDLPHYIQLNATAVTSPDRDSLGASASLAGFSPPLGKA